MYHVYDNFCLPHASLRVPLAAPEPTNGNGVSPEVAALHTGDGGRADGSRLDPAGGAPVSGATVATACEPVGCEVG